MVLALALISPFRAGAALPGDEHWDNQFGSVGPNDTLFSVTTFGGKLFVGGWFTGAGNTRANFVAGYNGTNWFPLNNGVSGGLNTTYIAALAADSSYLYAGGWFTNADGSGSRYLGRWDGNEWSPMGGSISNNPNSIVQAIKLSGTNIYVGGVFNAAGGVQLNGIGRWSGTNWFAVGAGIAGGSTPNVTCIEVDGDNVYVGGAFTQAGAVNATNVARWNGSAWSAMGNGFNGPVRALCMYAGSLYVGGSFTNSSLAITNLARWDGSSWIPVNANRSVWDLVSDGTNLYVGGNFSTVAGFGSASVSAAGIAKWNGSAWSGLGTGLGGFGIGTMSLGAYKMSWSTNRLYVGGVFNQAGGVGCSHVASWDGTNWSALGATKSKGTTHFLGQVRCFQPVGTNLYVGGIFTEAGSIIVNGVARWDRTNWSAVGTGFTNTFTSATAPPNITCLTTNGTNLYAGGNFTNSGGALIKGVARWGGTNWAPMASGLNGTVNALAVHKGVLFAGGSFTARGDGSGSLHGIAQWDGVEWQDVPIISAWRINNSISALVSDGTNLYVGGNYFVAWGFSPEYPDTGASVDNLGRWDGNFWWPIGTAPNNTVSSLCISNGVLYAGGVFTSIGGVSANKIAKCVGTNWTALGNGLIGSTASTTVSAIALKGSDVFVAGTFTNAGGVSGVNTLGIAKWNGASWSAPFGSGLVTQTGTASASTLQFIGEDLYVGGSFIFAGDKPSLFVARWNEQLNFYPPPQPRLTRMQIATNQVRLRVLGTSGENYIVQTSSNLVTWAPALTNSATFYDFFENVNSNAPSRFYRVFVP